MNNNYFLVETMCGHVGSGAYIPVTFPVMAENGREAAKIARSIPRVKHNNKYAILRVEKVDFEQYMSQQNINKVDPYLNWAFCDSEIYFNEVYSRVQHMKEREYFPKKKHHGKFNGKKCTAAKLYIKDLFSDLDDLLGNFSKHICKNF